MEVGYIRRLAGQQPSRVEQDLAAQPGSDGALYRQLYELADAIRSSAEEVANAVAGIALELDKAKRGTHAAASRCDSMAVLHDVQSLLGNNLLDDADKATVRAALLKQLGAVDAPAPVAAPVPRKRPAKAKARRASR